MDREKVIKGIETCEPSVFKRICTDCPYREEMNCDYVLWHDALALLKEQENASKRNPVIVCPHCGKRVK